MSLFPTPVVVRPLLYRETDVMLTVTNAIFKTFYLLLCKQMWKNQEKNNNKKLLNIVPHLPPSLSLTYVSISSVKKKKEKGISLYIQFENAFELHHCTVCMCACH